MAELKNILTEKFYDYLVVVIYNGPPNTEYGKYYGFVPTEEGICTAMQKCAYPSSMFKHIINPSDAVIKAYIDIYWYYDDIGTFVKNPSKDVIRYAISKNSNIIIKYQHLFDHEEIMIMINENPHIIKHIVDPTNDMYDLCAKLDGFTLKFVPFEKQTLAMCISAVTYIYTNRDKCWFYDSKDPFVNNIKHFDENIADMIANTHCLAIGLHKIPNNYITKKRFDDAFETNHKVINFIQYYPNNFLTQDIIDKIKFKKIYMAYRHIANIIDKHEMKLLVDDMLRENVRNIAHIPMDFQDEKMCESAITYDHRLLEHCYKIDANTLKKIFNKMVGTPKKTRFNFINEFDEDTIIRLIKIDERLIAHLDRKKMTDGLIRVALAFNGYNLQYVEDQTQEYINIALNNQPKAEKYIKILN